MSSEQTVKEPVVVTDDNGGAWFTLGILATLGTAAVGYWAKESNKLRSRVGDLEEGLSQVTRATTSLVHEMKELKELKKALLDLHASKADEKPYPEYRSEKGNGADKEAPAKA